MGPGDLDTIGELRARIETPLNILVTEGALPPAQMQEIGINRASTCRCPERCLWAGLRTTGFGTARTKTTVLRSEFSLLTRRTGRKISV